MLSQHTGVLARIIGSGMCLATTVCVACGVLGILSSAPFMPWWLFTIAFAFVGLSAWSLTSFGEWLWSIEERWFGLQHYLRLIQASLIGGGLACAFIFKIAHYYRLI